MKVKPFFLFFVSIFAYLGNVQAQISMTGNYTAPYTNMQGGGLDSLFRITDRFGNEYAHTTLSVPSDSLLPDSAKMTAGMFTLYFEDVMNSNPNPNSFTNAAARNLMVRVYNDLSAMLNYTSTAGRVRIYIRQSESVAGAAAMTGSSYYTLPKVQTQAVLYGDVYTAIVTGNSPDWLGKQYQGFMKLNSHYLYQLDPDAAFATGNEYDLYTIALHQALQILGLNTAMDMNTTLYTYATRYDLALQDANQTPLVTLNNGLPTWNSAIPTTNGCNSIYFAGLNTSQQVLYTPTTWQIGNSLSEIGCNFSGCSPDNFVMKHCIGTGSSYALRHPNVQEANMLADIGYQMTGVYGVGGSSSWWDYEKEFLMGGCNPVGMEDDASTNFLTPITIDVLGNDTGGGTNINLVLNWSGTALTWPNSAGTVTVVNTGGNNMIQFNPISGFYGGVLILYQPICGGIPGNITPVYIWVAPRRCAVTDCGENLTPCGDFETCYTDNNDFAYAATGATPILNNFPLRDPTTAFYLTNGPSNNSPDFYTGFATFGGVSCNNIPPAFAPNNPGLNYVGLVARQIAGVNVPEAFTLQLCKPVPPGTTGTLTFWARLGDATCNGNNITVNADFPISQPIPRQNVFTNPGIASGAGGASAVVTGVNYAQYTIPISNPTAVPLDWLLIYTNTTPPPPPYTPLFPNVFGYVLIDDMSLVLDEVDYTITKNVLGGNTYALGSTVTYEVEVCATPVNPATPTAVDIVVEDIIPEGFTGSFTWVSGTAPYVLVGNTLTITPNIVLTGGTVCQNYSYSLELENCECVAPVITNCAEIIQADSDCGLTNPTSCVDIYISPAPIITYTNINTSSLNFTAISGATISISGTFTVDNNFDINLTDIMLCEGAEIIVIGGASLNIQNSHLHGCLKLWRSVQCQNGGVLIMEKNLIEDAEFGVYALDGSNIDLRGNRFNRNFIGIHTRSTGGSFMQNITHLIEGNTFECTANILPAYTGQSSISPVPIPSTFAYSGVYAFDVGLTLTKNIFRDLPVGIMARRTNLFSDHCDFLDIHQHPAYTPGTAFSLAHGYGAAIWTLGTIPTATNPIYSLTVIGDGQNATANFIDCDKGVWAQRYNVRVFDNRMEEVQQGVRVELSRNRTIAIRNNYIHAYLRGVELLSNDISAGIWVQKNVIDIGMNLPPISTIPGIGIYINEANNPNLVLVERCTVNVYNAREGINISNQHSGNILRNQVQFFPALLSLIYASTARHGIIANNCDKLRINCNTAIGNILTGTISQNAFFIVNTRNSEIACNSSDNSTNGFHFAISCPGTDFRSNMIGTHFRGLLLNASAVIDFQQLKGNLWQTINPYGSGFGAFHIGTFAQSQLSLFAVNPLGAPTNFTYFPTYNLGSVPNWFYTDQGTNESCIDGVCLPLPSANANINGLDENVANGTFTTEEFPEESKYLVSEAIYSKYADNDSLLQVANDTIQTWVDSLAQQNIGELHELHATTAEVLNTSKSITALLRNAADSSYFYLDSLGVIDSLLQTATGNDSLLLLAQRANFVSHIAQIAENQREVLAPIDSVALTNLNTTNAAIQSSIQAELNQKAINEIYLATIAQGHRDFSQSQIEILADIAYQCPITGGNAVFLARGLYEFVNQEAVYDDEGTCAAQGEQWRHQNIAKEPIKVVQIFPNPTDELLNLIVPVSTETYEIAIYDAIGNMISTISIPKNTTEWKVRIQNIANGMYYCVVKQDNTVIHQEKVVIIHH